MQPFVFFVTWCNLFTKGYVLSSIEHNFIVKTNLLQTSFFQQATFVLFSLILSNTGFSVTYTTIADGSYNDCTIWDNGCPNNSIQQGDTVIINHVVNVSSSMNISGVLIINASGTVTSTNDIDVSTVGEINNDGYFTLDSELHLDGNFINSGLSVIYFLHIDGSVFNVGTIKVQDETYIHGGVVDGGGTLLTCNLDMENNNSSIDVTGSACPELFSQNLCCEDPNNPNPIDELGGCWLIDSANVLICEMPFIPNAGDNDVSSLCNSGGSSINLNTLLSVGVNPGIFAESTSSGSFDAMTGILNTDGLTPGTYTFTYTVIGYTSNDVSTFDITIFPVLNTSSSFNTCENELPFQWNGMALDQEGNYSVALTSVVTGCDSIVNLDFTINPTSTSLTQLSACQGDLPIEWNGISANEAGNYDVVIQNANGCDSVATLELSVQALEMPAILSQGTVECPRDIIDLSVEDISGAEFYWEGPMEYESQDLVNAFELDDSNSGLYSVYYVLNGCESEVAQIELNVENIFEYKQFDFPNVITANDDNVNDEIEVEKYVGKCSDFTLTVRDRWGNQVYVQKRGEPSFNGNSILGEKLPEGVYFYKLTHNQGSASGFIHLLK